MNDLDIFINAPDGLADSELAAYFDKVCGDDADLRARVEELLAAGGVAGTEFLEKGPLKSIPALDGNSVPMAEKSGDVIGNYKLLQQIGEGGFGIVYMAEQSKPVKRKVALKIIKLGMDTKEVVARFEVERQALAMMDHPNIATVYDAGSTDTGRPFFVMELVRGISITQFCDGQSLSTDERLNLFIDVCHAVQHAHQKGIIHRDLKPSNVMVTLHDDKAVVKVIDFGVAKATHTELTDKTLFTRFEQFIGTPAYMSPEQAQMSGLDIDTRSDIYALGVLLYELLTGVTPFDAETLRRAGHAEILRIIREEDPPKPSTRIRTSVHANRTNSPNQFHYTDSRALRGDLDSIVMKCLEKDRARRYESANSLAMDLRRHLGHEPVLARPPSATYRLRKAWQRNKTACIAGLAVLLALAVGTAVATVGWVQALDQRDVAVVARAGEKQQREQAEAAKRDTRLRAYTAEINVAFQALAENNLGRARELLDRQRPAPRERDLRGLEWRHLWDLCQGDELATFRNAPSTSASFSSEGKLLAFAAGQNTVIRDVASRKVVKTLSQAARTVAFSPRDNLLATATYSVVKVWDTGTWGEVRSLPGAHFPAIFSPNGQFLVAGSGDGFGVWNTKTWERTGYCESGSLWSWHMRHALAFSPDGELLFTPGGGTAAKSSFQVWKLPSLEPLGGFASLPDILGSAAFLAEGNRLLTGQFDGSLCVWDVSAGKIIETLREHTGWITAIVAARDGKTFVTASTDRSIVVWDAETLQPLTRLRGHLAEIWALAISPDGQVIASASQDGLGKLWDAATRRGPSDLTGAHKTVGFVDGGRVLVAASSDGLMLTDVVTGETSEIPISGMHDPSNASNYPAAVQRGGPLVVLGLGSTVELWDTLTQSRKASWGAFDETIATTAFSPDGRHVAAASITGVVKVYDVAKQSEVARFQAGKSNLGELVFSPDSKLLALGRNAHVTVWDVARKRKLLNLGPHNGEVVSIAFSPDGRLLAAAAVQGNEANLWAVPSGKLVATLRGHVQGVVCVAFTPDGKTLATGSHDRRVKLWNVATWQELATLPLDGIILSLVFSPDGRSLAAGHEGKPRLRLWRVPSFEEIEAVESKAPSTRTRTKRD